MLMLAAPFRWIDLLDIFLVSVLLYQIYQIVKGTVAIRIFLAVLTVYLLYWLVTAMDMHLLSGLLGQFTGLGMLALIILFQPEIRRFFILVGSNAGRRRIQFLRKIFPSGSLRINPRTVLNTEALQTALERMSAARTGALLVILRESELKYYSRSGVAIEAKLSADLLEQLFYKNSPLHDGAVLIRGNTILSAKCMLPLTENQELPGRYGMRHRAAIGITEVSDAISVVVSEETGEIAMAVEGRIHHNLAPKDVIRLLKEL